MWEHAAERVVTLKGEGAEGYPALRLTSPPFGLHPRILRHPGMVSQLLFMFSWLNKK